MPALVTMTAAEAADLVKVGPKGYVHGWRHIGGAAADTLNLASSARDRKITAKGMSDAELKAANKEFARRATALGKTGAVSKAHKTVKDEIARRKAKA
jgi:hypothetical protein